MLHNVADSEEKGYQEARVVELSDTPPTIRSLFTSSPPPHILPQHRKIADPPSGPMLHNVADSEEKGYQEARVELSDTRRYLWIVGRKVNKYGDTGR